MKSEFTSLPLEFSQGDPTSVYYAHAQNLVSLLKHSLPTEITVLKLDAVLFDIYSAHTQLQVEQYESTLNLKRMLTECTTIIGHCKEDRESISQLTEERHSLIIKLRASTDESLAYLQQNQQLHQTMDSLQQLNSLLNQKNSFLEEQLSSLKTGIKAGQKFANLKLDYEKILKDNHQIQLDLGDIAAKTKIMEKWSLPMQIISLACTTNSEMKKMIWETVEKTHKDDFGDIQETKKAFLNYDFSGVMQMMK